MFKNLSPQALGISGRDSEIIELVLSYGFKGLDLDLVEFAEEVKKQGLARAARLIASARLKIGSFALPLALGDDEAQFRADLEKLPALAEVAEGIGCTRATTVIEPGSDSRPYHENFELHRKRLADVAAVLTPRKIRLGIGFLAPTQCRAGHAFQFIQTFDELLLLLRSVGSPQVGLALDTWHWHLGGGKLEQLSAQAADKLVTVSLADAPAEVNAQTAELASRRLPAEGGAIDLAGVLATLAELRYDGPVTPAPDKSQFAASARDKIVKSAGAALDAVWKAAGLNAAGKLAAVPGR
jgi:sugar phosphate isomerase/epimerase